MTAIKHVTQAQMKAETGFTHALGYAFPETNTILVRTGLPKKIKHKVLEHEEAHLLKGEEGPFLGQLAGAAIGAIGGGLGGSNAGSKPPKWLRKDQKGFGQDIEDYFDAGQYPAYPDALPIGPINQYEGAALEGYGNLANTATGLGDWYTRALAGGAGNNPASAYAGGFANAPGLWNQAAAGGAPSVPNQQINPNQGLYGSSAGINADPNAALSRMLSGQVNTGQLQGALDSAYEPMLRNFNERVMPSILQADDAYTGGQGGSGKTKIAQRVGQDLGRAMTSTAGSVGYNAFLDAQNRQTQGAGIATDARLGTSAQNLQGAQLGQNLGFQQAGNQLTADLANQGSYFDYLDSTARAGGVGAGAAGTAGNLDLAYLSQIPNAYNLYAGAPNANAAAGGLQRGITDPLYANEFNRQQYTNQLPLNMLQNQGDLLSQLAGGTGRQQTTGPANPYAAALMGGISGWAGAPPQQVPQGSGGGLPSYQQNVANDWIFG